ncbi:MAG: M20 family metallopeptidase [Bacillota bacterium]|nr:M20 family metallopeptidase [Bacillota bacterium]
MNLQKLIKQNIDIIKNVRRELHENAELAFNEHKTQKIILDFLNKLGIDTQICAKTGVVATINKGEACIGIRADMDALPINGVSHVCGHDFHMAVVLGAAMILKEIGYNKCIKFIFQPAEEGEGGALPMINEGVLKNPEVKAMVGFHVWPGVSVGKIEVTKGASMASADDFRIKFKGVGGHAAMPHICKNPIYPVIDFIETINIKSRIEQNPLNSHIVTVSAINGGSVPNAIAEEVEVMGTVRTFDNELRKKLRDDIEKVARLSAEKYNCEVEIDYRWQYPPLISNANLTELFIETTKSVMGKENVLPLEKTFAAEDFSFFAEKVPSVHFRLGISDCKLGLHPLHSPEFDASEEAILYGVYAICNFIISMYNEY